MPSSGSMAGWVQIPPPARAPLPQVSFAMSQPSSCGPCGMVLNTHLIAPVVASTAARIGGPTATALEVRFRLKDPDGLARHGIQRKKLRPGVEIHDPIDNQRRDLADAAFGIEGPFQGEFAGV